MYWGKKYSSLFYLRFYCSFIAYFKLNENNLLCKYQSYLKYSMLNIWFNFKWLKENFNLLHNCLKTIPIKVDHNQTKLKKWKLQNQFYSVCPWVWKMLYIAEIIFKRFYFITLYNFLYYISFRGENYVNKQDC